MKKIFLFICIFNLSIAFAFAEVQNTMTPGNVPTKIDADVMDYIPDENKVIFRGNVFVEREEFNLWADTITILLKTTETQNTTQATDQLIGLQTGDIEKIIATNNVRIKYNTQTGTCGKATYDAGKALLIMEDKPVLQDGVNSISGQEIRYYMEENRSEVIGGKQRVEALFSTAQPDSLKKSLNN